MKILPQRFGPLIVCLLAGPVGGALVGLRMYGPSGGALSAAGVGALISAGFAIAFMAFVFQQDSRFIFLQAHFPDAIVVQAFRDKENTNVLIDLAANELRDTSFGLTFTIAFDAAGFSVWTGGRQPTRISTVTWSEVSGMELGTSFRPERYGAQPYSRLRIELKVDGAGPRLMVGIERLSRFGWGSSALGEAEIIELIACLEKLRGTGPRVGRAALSQVSAGLIPGPTAWSLSHIGPIPVLSFGWLSQLAFIGGVVSVMLNWPSFVAIGFLVVAALIFGGMLIRARQTAAARMRETRAGYTTLNGVELALEQRDPVSGRVVRAAGDLPLTKDEFAQVLRQSS